MASRTPRVDPTDARQRMNTVNLRVSGVGVCSLEPGNQFVMPNWIKVGQMRSVNVLRTARVDDRNPTAATVVLRSGFVAAHRAPAQKRISEKAQGQRAV